MPLTMAIFHAKRYEPVKRNHGNGPEYIGHRFPIKGGISLWEVMVRQIAGGDRVISEGWEKVFKRGLRQG